MVRVQSFVAVNESHQAGTAEQQATQESRESNVIGLYERALRSVQRKDAEDAKACFRAVLDDPLVQDSMSQQMQRIRFLSLKNLGSLLAVAGGSAAAALDCYVSACELDGTDVVLWNRLGTLASDAGFWALARHAFERGLECSPTHPTMHAKLQLLLRHVGAAELPASVRGAAAGAGRQQGAMAQPLPAAAAGLLRLQPLSAALAEPVMAPELALEPKSVKVTEPSWPALLNSIAFLCSSKQPMPSRVQLRLPAEKRPVIGKAAAAVGTAPATATAAGTFAASAEQVAGVGSSAVIVEEVVRLQLTPGKSQKSLSVVQPEEGGQSPPLAASALGTAQAAAATEAATPVPVVIAQQFTGHPVDEDEHVAVELLIQPIPVVLGTTEKQYGPETVVPTPQPGQPVSGDGGLDAAAAAAGETPAVALTREQAMPPSGLGTRNGSVSRSGRKRRSRRGQQAEQEAGAPMTTAQGSLLSLLDLLGLSDSTQQGQQQHEPQGGAGGPAEASGEGGLPGDQGPLDRTAVAAGDATEASASGGSPLAGTAGSAGSQQAQLQVLGPAAPTGSASAAGVRAYIRSLPEAGLHPSQLLLGLVRQLAGSREALSALSASERVLLLKAAEQVHLDGQSCGLQADCCMVLAELCISEAAASAAAVAAPLGGARRAGSEAAAGKPGRGQSGRLVLDRKDSGRGRSSKVARSTSPAQLRQQAEQWLLRHMAVTVATALEGAGKASQLPEHSLGAVPPPPALEASAAALAEAPESGAPSDVTAAGAAVGEGSLQPAEVAGSGAAATGGMAVRYWWARGQLDEAKGAASGAAQFYQRCLQALEDSGLPAVNVPHWCQLQPESCKPTGALAITAEAVHNKLEVLRMHDIVAEADVLAQQAQHEEVADSLAEFLLPCNAKEDSMSALDVQCWQHALTTLREAALASSRPWLAAAAQLRIMWHALARLPTALEVGTSSVAGAGPDSALAAALRGLLASHSLAFMDMATVLEASVHFFDSHGSQLQQRHGGGLVLTEADRTWSEWEWLLLRRAQQRLLGLIEGCRLMLAGDTRSSHLSLNASSQHRAMRAAAALTVYLWALDPAAQHSPKATVELVRPLCEVLAQGHVLMEAEGAFVLLCLRQLREAHDSLVEQYGKDVLDKEEGEDIDSEGEPGELSDARDLYWDLIVGLHNCLHWLYGIDLIGREEEPWAEGFEAPHLAGRLLNSRQACVEVWPLVSEYLLEMDGKDLQAFKGFIDLVAAHFLQPPAAALHRLEEAWYHLAAAELPHDFLAGDIVNPLETLWRPTKQQRTAQRPLGAPPAEGVAAGVAALTSAGVAFMAPEGAPAMEGHQGLTWADVSRAGGVQTMDIDEAAAEVVAAAVAGISSTAQLGVAGEPGAAAAAAGQREQREVEQQEQPDEEDDGHRQVRSSLYRLLALQHSDLEEALSGGSLLSSEAEAALESMLAPCKYDLLYNPTSFVAWEQLAASYHEAADWLLEEAVKTVTPQDWNSQQFAAVRERARRYSHMGYHCTALALKYVGKEDGAEDEKAKLLAISGTRLYSDQQRVPPCFSRLLDESLTPEAAQQRRQGYERAFKALQQASVLHPDDWELVLGQAKCLQKLGHPPSTWLPQLARACHLASALRAGTPLDAVYALHAARLKLLLGVSSGLDENSAAGRLQPGTSPAADSAVVAAGEGSWEGQLPFQVLKLVGRYCFTRQAQQLLGYHDASVRNQTEADMEGEEQQRPLEESAQDGNVDVPAAEEPAAAAAAVSKAQEPRQMLQSLLEDCLEGLRWCLQRDRQFHRAAYRLAEARLVLEGRQAAIQELTPLFSKLPKQPFCISVARIGAGDGADAAPGGKKRKGARGRKAQQGPAHDVQQGEVAESDWGLCPVRASAPAREESSQQYYGSVRKYLRRYLQLLAEEGQLNLLRMAGGYLSTNSVWGPAALPAFGDVRQLASGQLVLCMIRSMGHICPPARLLSVLASAAALPGVGAEGLAEDGSSSQAVASDPKGPSMPAEPSRWAQPRTELQEVAQQLEGCSNEALLEALHQFWVEHSLQHREEGQGWEQAVLVPAQLALSSSNVEPGSAMFRELVSSNDLFRASAELYVLLLGRHNKLEQLLAVARGLRLRAKGAAQQQQPPQQSQPSSPLNTHPELIFQQAVSTLRQSTTTLHEAAGKVRPELIAPYPLPPASAAQSANAGPLLQPLPAPQDGQPTWRAASPIAQRVPEPPGEQQELRQGGAALPQVGMLGQHPAASAMHMLPRQLLYAPSAPGIPPQLQQQLAMAAQLRQQMALQAQAQMDLQRQQWQQQQAQAQGLQEQAAMPPAIGLGPPTAVQGPEPSQAALSLASSLAAGVQQGQLSRDEATHLLQQFISQELQQHQPQPLPQPPALPSSVPYRQQQSVREAPAEPAAPEQQSFVAASMSAVGVPGLAIGSLLVPAGKGPWGHLTGLMAHLGWQPGAMHQPLPLSHTSPAAQQAMRGSPARSPAATPAKGDGSPRLAAVAGDPAPSPANATTEPAGQSTAVLQPAEAVVAEAAVAQAEPHTVPASPGITTAPTGTEAGEAAAAPGAVTGPAMPPSPASAILGAAVAGVVPPAAELPAPPPLTAEESELVDRAVELLRQGREVYKLVSQTAQGMAYRAKCHTPLLRSVEELLASLYRIFAALARRPGPPTKGPQLLKACDQVVKEHRRLSQRGIATGGTAAAAGAGPAGFGGQAAIPDGSEGEGPKAGARKRGRPPRAGSRELSVAAEERQGPGSVAAGGAAAGSVLGSARKRTRRDVSQSASASPQPMQQLPVLLEGGHEGLLLSPGGACRTVFPGEGTGRGEPGAAATISEAAVAAAALAADITVTEAAPAAAAEVAPATEAQDPMPAAEPANESEEAGQKRAAPESGQTEGMSGELIRQAKRQRSGDSGSSALQPGVVGDEVAERAADIAVGLGPAGRGGAPPLQPLDSTVVEPVGDQTGAHEDR